MPSPELPVTVVIPAYRRPDMVERAIRSVRAQEPHPAEIIVVDDASGDETGARAKSLGARLITHERNLGEGGARNTGLEAAANDWVALLDCDDEWLPGHLEALWAARDGHVVVGTAMLGAGDDPVFHRVYGWTGRRPRVLRGPADIAVPDTKLLPSAVLVLRQAALAAGGFPLSMPRAGDLDAWLRLLEQGSALAIPRVTALYHMHGEQVSADPELMRDAHREVIEAYADRPWYGSDVRLRFEGVVAWDRARAAIAGGAPRPATMIGLARALAAPQRAAGVFQLLARRFRARRMAARFGPGGVPAVAFLSGATADPDGLAGSVDLRDRGLPSALLYMLRRPPSQAIVPGPAARLAVRMLGVKPVSAS